METASASASTALSLKEYLKRYEAAADDPKKKKKKKKKKEMPKSDAMGGVRVVDEDPVWQKPVQIEEEESDSAGEEKPQVDEDIEVKRMKRLEAIRSRKPYNAISEDGSGWVSISNPSKPSNAAEGSRDLSPPRQRRARFDTPSPEPKQRPSDAENADLSPPRQRRRRFDSPELEIKASGSGVADVSPPRRQSTEDLSPPRRARRRSPEVEASRGSPMADLSPPRRTRKSSPEDLSPPRRVRRRSQEPVDLSPPRRTRKSSPGDISAPRSARRRSPDAQGPRQSPATDLSPRRRSHKGSSADLSPPRRVRQRSPDIVRRQGSPSADLSPPRKSRKEAPMSKETRKTGLLSAQEIKDEINQKKKEELSRFASMDPSISGRGAAPVFRDEEGKRILKEELMKSKEEEKPKEKNLEWGKGLAQKREAEARALELELEKDRPFARTRDDPELDKMLKERIRWGDPMAHLVKKKNPEPVLEDLGDNEKMKESGFIIPQTIPSHSWMKRGLDFPSNRYGIRPGRHWDGVDRSNGYEKEMFKRQNESRATEREAYLWSVSDM